MKSPVRMALPLAPLVLAAAVGGGCRAPKLASRPLTPTERTWCEVMQRNYPGWTPPYYSPVVAAPPVRKTPAAAPVRTPGRRDRRRTGPARPVAPPRSDAPPREDPEFVPAD